jgi:hypothetical protein
MFARLGWLFAGFGMIFVFIFAGNADLSTPYYFRGKLETVSGIVTATKRTGFSENKTQVFAYYYRFQNDGVEREGTSYRTGDSAASLGEQVTVEFPVGRPGCSRIQGMRCAVFGPWSAFVIIFPLLGIAVVAVSFRAGWKNRSLLTNGEPALARCTGKEMTNTEVNNRYVYKVWFEFTDRGGALQRTFTRTASPENLEGSTAQTLFYDPRQPSRSMLLHGLAGNVTLDERGNVNPCGAGQVLGVLWPAAIFAVFVLVGLYLQSRL